jgi:hypothetical protein
MCEPLLILVFEEDFTGAKPGLSMGASKGRRGGTSFTLYIPFDISG